MLQSISSFGYLLASFPEASVPFRKQSDLLGHRTVHPQPARYQKVGLFIWVNREYLDAHPPPRDIEAAYMRWATKATNFPLGSCIHFESFLAAFPIRLRSPFQVGHLFEIA